MARRARFAVAAEAWLRGHGRAAVSSDELWAGLSREYPELTTPSETRKTPRSTCMRDLRKDPAFEVGNRKIKLR
jgi:hypothetical protein